MATISSWWEHRCSATSGMKITSSSSQYAKLVHRLLFDSVRDLKHVLVTDHIKSVRQTRLTYVVRLAQSLLCVICALIVLSERHDVLKWRDWFSKSWSELFGIFLQVIFSVHHQWRILDTPKWFSGVLSSSSSESPRWWMEHLLSWPVVTLWTEHLSSWSVAIPICFGSGRLTMSSKDLYAPVSGANTSRVWASQQ